MSDQFSPAENAMLGRIERTSLITEVMDRIRGFIDTGNLPSGSKLPSERQLQQQLGVGRSTVREALRALEALGVVEIRQGRGAVVRAAAPPSGAGSGNRASFGEDWSQLGPVVEARLAIETYAASLAALRRTDASVEAMNVQLGAFDEAIMSGDLRALILADVEFHAVIADTASPALATCLDSISVLVINSRQMSLSRAERLPSVAAKHRQIFDAIVAQDPTRAAAAMSEHLLTFISELGLEVATLPPLPSRQGRLYVVSNQDTSPSLPFNTERYSRSERKSL